MPEFRTDVPFRPEWIVHESENRLQEQRLSLNMTIDHLARLVGIHSYQYRQLELGVLSPLTERNCRIRPWVQRLPTYLHKSLDYLFPRHFCSVYEELIDVHADIFSPEIDATGSMISDISPNYSLLDFLDLKDLISHLLDKEPIYGKVYLEHLLYNNPLTDYMEELRVSKQYIHQKMKDVKEVIRKYIAFHNL